MNDLTKKEWDKEIIKTRTASSYAGVQEVCISPAQRKVKLFFIEFRGWRR